MKKTLFLTLSLLLAFSSLSAQIPADPKGWKTGDFTTTWTDYVWNFTADDFRAGENSIVFTYTNGACKLCLKEVVIMADGEVVLTDETEQSAGANPRSATYTFSLASAPTTLTMNAKARTSGGTSSNGVVMVNGILFIPDGATEVKNQAYYGNTSITRVTLPESVQRIGSLSFHSCANLQAINIPAAVDTIGKAAFQNCTALTEVTLNEGLEAIEYRTFKTTALTSVTIPSTVKFIGEEAFRDCNELRHVYLTTGIETWGKNAFLTNNPIVLHFTDTGDNAVISGTTCYAPAGSKMAEVASAIGIKTLKTSDFLELSSADTIADGQYRDYTMLRKISLGTWVKSIGQEPFPSTLKELRNYNNAYVDEWACANGWHLAKVTEHYREYSRSETGALADDTDYWSVRRYRFDREEVTSPVHQCDTLPALSLPYRVSTKNNYVNNIGLQDYLGVRKDVIFSYLAETEDHRLMAVSVSEEGIWVEYFTSQFQRGGGRRIDLELPIFGGFCASDDGYYYVAEGQLNNYDSDAVETFRFIKYDKYWNRVGATSVFGSNTSRSIGVMPLTMMVLDGHLLVRTGHIMYAGSDGVKHQANCFFDIDTRDMSLVYKQTGIAASYVQYVSHSFNQLHTVKNGTYVGLDHGDAYPRALVISKNKYAMSEMVGGAYYATKICEFPGAVGNNYTGATVGGFASSDTHLLTAYTLADTANFETSKTQNLYLTATQDLPDGFGEHTHRQVTHYKEGATSVPTPHLVKYGANDFLLLWTHSDSLYYAHVDGEGNIGQRYAVRYLDLSDCTPIVYNGYLTWFLSNGRSVDGYRVTLRFIRIDLEDLSQIHELYLKSGDVSAMTDVYCTESVADVTGEKGFGHYFSMVSKVTIDGSVQSIGQDAFRGATRLATVVINDGVQSIGAGCFYGCSSNLVIHVPSSVTSIGADAASPSATWVVEAGSYAHQYAVANSLKFVLADATSIAEEAVNETVVSAIGHNIVVENADAEICVFDAVGQLIWRENPRSRRTEIGVGAAGIYTVQVGTSAKKLIVE